MVRNGGRKRGNPKAKLKLRFNKLQGEAQIVGMEDVSPELLKKLEATLLSDFHKEWLRSLVDSPIKTKFVSSDLCG